MKRREFIVKSCYTGLALAGSCLLLSECKTTGFREVNNELLIPLKSFAEKNTLIVNSKKLQQKIIVIRKDDVTYKAYSMICTHKGAELEQKDDLLVCPAHGSMFDLDGNVVSVPAKTPLKSFIVSVKEINVVVHLL